MKNKISLEVHYHGGIYGRCLFNNHCTTRPPIKTSNNNAIYHTWELVAANLQRVQGRSSKFYNMKASSSSSAEDQDQHREERHRFYHFFEKLIKPCINCLGLYDYSTVQYDHIVLMSDPPPPPVIEREMKCSVRFTPFLVTTILGKCKYFQVHNILNLNFFFWTIWNLNFSKYLVFRFWAGLASNRCH